MRIAIVPHAGRPRSIELAGALTKVAAAQGLDVVGPAGDADLLELPPSDLDETSGIDLIVAIGGDGTVLKAVRLGRRSGAPIYGINAGSLGFLAEGEPESLVETVGRISERRWWTSDRMMVQASVNGGEPVFGLNDVVVEKVESQRTVKLAVAVDGEPFITYAADGVVVAAPTGSTAYNLSAGGPLVDPEVDALIMTPVAAHSLFSRGLVFPPERTLRLEVLEDRSVGVSVDGEVVGTVDPGGVVTVTRAPDRVTFVSLSGRTYPTTLKEKFSLE